MANGRCSSSETLALMGRFDPVPVEEHDDQHQHGQQQYEAGEGPDQVFYECASLHRAPDTTERPDCDAQRETVRPKAARHEVYD